MGYDPTIYKTVKEQIEQSRKQAQAQAERRADEVRETVDGVRELDDQLAATGLRIWQESQKGIDGLAERLAALQSETEALRAKRAKLLTAAGYPADYTDPRYACPICEDDGFLPTKAIALDGPENRMIATGRMCDCMKKALCKASAESTGIGALIERQTFDNFKTEYYIDPARAERNLRRCRSFAEKPEGNLLLLGATGLGKTHLSSAIAGAAIALPRYVVYETAPTLFSAFESEHFGRKWDDSTENKTDKYFDCELLILDDLGAEMTTAFTLSALYELLNHRINRRMPTVVSTNLSSKELAERYTDRIASRLLGEFQSLLFEGRDIRLLKKSK